MSIPQKDLKILWGKAAGRCSMPECRDKLVTEASKLIPSKNILIGQNCHIVGEKEDGPRGKSILTPEERNRYPNLILLCVNHHTTIDQDPESWPIEKLHQIKSDHEIWVETRLTDDSSDLSNGIYSDLVNTATDCLLLEHWDWFSDHAVRLLLYEKFVDGSDHFYTKVQKTIWPHKIPELEDTINNLAERVNTYVRDFLNNARIREGHREDSFFVEDKWWKAKWREDYHDYVEKSNKWQKQVTDLLFNVVVALNAFSEAVRKHIKPNYLVYRGKFVVNDELGVLSEMKSSFYIPRNYIELQK